MIDDKEAQARCAQLVERARALGADAAEAIARASSSESVNVRLGKLEDVERSESEEIGLRLFVGQRSASIHTSDFSDAALDDLANRAFAMAKAAPEDKYSGLAPAEMLAKGDLPELDLLDRGEPTPERLRDRASQAEDAARAVGGVTNSEGGSASFGAAVFGLVTSNGFSGGYSASNHGLSASVIAGEGANMQRDYAYRTARHELDLLQPDEIGRMAGERAVARLDPVSLPSGPMTVLFDPRVSGSLIGHLLGAMSGPAVARGSSFLLGKEGDRIFDSAITILDDPHVARGPRSRPFDAEGLPTAPRVLIDKGDMTGWLANLAAARQLGIEPTGHASRASAGAPGVSASNVHMRAGTASVGELMADVKDGVLITEMIGQGVNGVTGDYSRGASGFRIVNGELTGPVAEITVAGNLVAMFAALTPANDLEMHRGINAPTLRVDGMTVAGE